MVYEMTTSGVDGLSDGETACLGPPLRSTIPFDAPLSSSHCVHAVSDAVPRPTSHVRNGFGTGCRVVEEWYGVGSCSGRVCGSLDGWCDGLG